MKLPVLFRLYDRAMAAQTKQLEELQGAMADVVVDAEERLLAAIRALSVTSAQPQPQRMRRRSMTAKLQELQERDVERLEVIGEVRQSSCRPSWPSTTPAPINCAALLPFWGGQCDASFTDCSFLNGPFGITNQSIHPSRDPSASCTAASTSSSWWPLRR